MFGHFDAEGNELPSALELVRLAIPRRVYTQSHFDYIVEVLDDVKKNISKVNGYKITYQPKFLRHFTCHFSEI